MRVDYENTLVRLQNRLVARVPHVGGPTKLLRGNRNRTNIARFAQPDRDCSCKFDICRKQMTVRHFRLRGLHYRRSILPYFESSRWVIMFRNTLWRLLDDVTITREYYFRQICVEKFNYEGTCKKGRNLIMRVRT